ncbi:MAG: hypothetical protein AB8G99_22780, partial [Planctomycetaceae bacterium]
MAAIAGRNRQVVSAKATKPPDYHASQMKFSVLQLNGNKLHDLKIIEHVDQDFSAYATPWERRFSHLVGNSRWHRKTQAVVNHQYVVIGYTMTVSGRSLYAPTMGRQILQRLLKEGVPVYVDNKPADGWDVVGFTEEIWTVIVAVDGEVLAVLDSTVVGVEPSDCQLYDLVEMGQVVAKIGVAVAEKVVRSLVRRGTRKKSTQVLTGRTVAKAREAMVQATARATTAFVAKKGSARSAGMTEAHFSAMKAAAKETGLIGIVRNTNAACIKLIKRGCPAKPVDIKANTDALTGVVTAKNKGEIDDAVRAGYYVVDGDGVARRRFIGADGLAKIEELKLSNPFWKVQKNQIIQGGQRPLPLTGDYDLMGVIDPKSVGQNLALVAKNGRDVVDISGPTVDRFRRAINPKLDQQRVMHGAQDQFASFR